MPETFVTYQGKRLTPYMAWVLDGVDRWLQQNYKLRLVVNDGIRTQTEQAKIFFDRYVLAGDVNGRRVYDTRWYQGKLWYRIDSRGTVAPPNSPQANHLIQGSGASAIAAADIADSGKDAGITVRTSVRGRAIRVAAKKLRIEFEGDSFNEGWHIIIRNIWQAVPKPPAPKTKGTIVKQIVKSSDATSKTTKHRTVNPGSSFYLHEELGQPTGHASNIVGGPGPYSLVVHAYVNGRPGDVFQLQLMWQNPKVGSSSNSNHYLERVTLDRDGQACVNVPFQNSVASGYAVYARLTADADNAAPITVTRLDTDAYLFG